MKPLTLSPDLELRLAAFVRGELSGAALDALERAIDEDPKLQARIAELAAELTELGTTANLEAGAPAVRLVEGAPTDRHLELGPLLGSGGMANVYSATQSHLGRPVAVKTVPPGASAWAREKLVQEARITGYLEHPGIVPVHDLIEDERGELQVVLKRIEGKSWSWLMAHPDEVKARFDVAPLEWHVSVAVSVSRALQFAHERGVVHRDVKPANVMIGSFGEVYLLDWGIAGTLTPQPGGMLPSLADVPFAGTLAHMAPEQLTSDVAAMGPATDTYLLAGCLYQAVFGAAPFGARTLDERKASPAAVPPFPAATQLPDELLAILKRGLEPSPAARFASADAFRRALEVYLKHRDARRLAERALEKAGEARRSWADGNRRQGQQAAADAEFGFRAALELSPDDVQLEQQRKELAADAVRAAVEQGESRAASYLLEGLEAPPPVLVQQVGEAVKTEVLERVRLEGIALGGDRRFGLGPRRAMLAGFGLAWLGFWWWVAASPPASALPLLGFLLGYAATATAVTLAMRDVMLSHRLNREMLLVQCAMVMVSAALALVAPQLGLSVPMVLTHFMFIWALGMAAVAAIVEPMSVIPAMTWLLAGIASALRPEALRPALAVGAAVHFGVPMLVSLRVKQR
ncbi:MAG: serine/threonine protein kinase [Myxococcaceae bacterium]|nr:serine/threonine protein kinase [Myxococcaceae bacterium]